MLEEESVAGNVNLGWTAHRNDAVYIAQELGFAEVVVVVAGEVDPAPSAHRPPIATPA